MNRIIIITLIAILAAPSLTVLQLASAASTPSVPQFTVKQVDRSYDVPATYDIDPYTGKTL